MHFYHLALGLIYLPSLADIDECALDTDNCDMNANCTDTVGSFFCTCVEGFRGNGINCTGLKHPLAICVFKHITYCNGIILYVVHSKLGDLYITFLYIMSCADINECLEDTDNCHPDATCSNTIGSFNCTCNSGYTGSGIVCDGECIRNQSMSVAT